VSHDALVIETLMQDDIPACSTIFDAAYNALHRKYGFEVEDEPDSDWLRPILTRFLATDPQRSLIARTDNEPIAFGSSFRRDDYWFLSFLFVLPSAQGQGVGRRVLEELLDREEGADRATVVESFQPVSTGLYASLGMTPRSIKYWVSEIGRPGSLPALPDDIRRSEASEGGQGQIDDLDRALLGFARPVDHSWWQAAGQACHVFRHHGELIAYAYVDDGFIGPALARDEQTLSAVVADLVRTADSPSTVSINVCNDSASVLQMLINAGGRIDDKERFRYVYCSSDGPLPSSYIHHSDWLP